MTKFLLAAVSLPLPALFVSAVVAEEGLPGLTTLIVPGLVIILLVILNGLFVASEFALIVVRPTQMEQLTNEGNRNTK